MPGAGIEIRIDSEYADILAALKKASMPDLKAIADFAGAELDRITKKAFEKQQDPVTGQAWAPLKHPRVPYASKGKSNGAAATEWGPILDYSGQLKRSLDWQSFPDGSLIFGSNMVYAGRHQKTRPYMGVPEGFDRDILSDPAVMGLLGLGGNA